MKIKGYKLYNIQSWDDKSSVVNLSENTMNCIIAPSETGKSVIIKMLKEMCFPGNWGYTRESLLRRGADYGYAMFFLEDDTVVTFRIDKSNYSYMVFYKGNQEDYKCWSYKPNDNPVIPDEVATLMGLVIDKSAKTVINVLDKTMPVPFVTASPELNARLMSTVTNVPELDARRRVLEEWDSQLKMSFSCCKRIFKIKKDDYEKAPVIDVFQWRQKKYLLETLRTLAKPCQELFSISHDMQCLVKPEPVQFTDLDTCFILLKELEQLTIADNVLNSLKKPEECKELNTNLFDELVDISKCVDSLVNTIDAIEHLVKPVEVQSVELDKEFIVLNKLFDLLKLGLGIKTVIKSKPECIEDISINDKVFEVLALLEQLMNISNTISELAGAISETKTSIIIIEESIKSIETELKVCPLCGKPLL